MTELDRESLEAVHAWAEKRLDGHDRRRRLAPLMEAMSIRARELTTTIVPDIMAGPEAEVRKAVVASERRLEESPGKLREIETEYQGLIESARQRTAALRQWLGELS